MNLLHDLSKKLGGVKDKKFLLGVSGGMDSMALMAAFQHLRQHFNFDYSVAYFHHGPSQDDEQAQYRGRAFDFVKAQCQAYDVCFYSNYPGNLSPQFLASFKAELKNEEECRLARRDFLESKMHELGLDHVVLAHHQEDLLETRLIRMLRGVGPQGLQAMVLQSGCFLRPFLDYKRDQLQSLLNEKGVSWFEDPSNESLDPFRNWLRQTWLPLLEEKRPGAVQALSRSLDLFIELQLDDIDLSRYIEPSGINLSAILELNPAQLRQVLASYMKGQGLKDYGLSHINEVVKRLDREEKSHTFRLLGRVWQVDAGRMRVQGPG